MARPARRRGTIATRVRRMTVTQTVIVLILAVVAARTWPVLTAIVGIALGAALVWPTVRRRPRARRGYGTVRRGGVAATLLSLWRAYRPAARQRRTTLAQFLACDPGEFEQAVAALAHREPDVAAASVHGGADDRGLDVLVQLRDGRRILIQCKRYAIGNKVGSEHVQIVNGTYRDVHGCDEAAIVTTSRFTDNAGALNRELVWPVRLVDGDGLVTWANGGPPPWRRH